MRFCSGRAGKWTSGRTSKQAPHIICMCDATPQLCVVAGWPRHCWWGFFIVGPEVQRAVLHTGLSEQSQMIFPWVPFCLPSFLYDNKVICFFCLFLIVWRYGVGGHAFQWRRIFFHSLSLVCLNDTLQSWVSGVVERPALFVLDDGLNRYFHFMRRFLPTFAINHI